MGYTSRHRTWEGDRALNWRTLFGYRLLAAMLAILVIVAVGVTVRDPFDFDDRPHIERLMKLALTNAQADTAVDMEERMWAQVKLAEAGDLSSVSARDWETMSKSFLAHNPGYVGLQLLDRTYHETRASMPLLTFLLMPVCSRRFRLPRPRQTRSRRRLSSCPRGGRDI